MKTIIVTVSLVLGIGFVSGQAVPSNPMDAAKPFTASSAPIPKHLVYRHFLMMVNDTKNKAVTAGEADPYSFAQPFARAGMENADWDTLIGEAKALAQDLADHDVKVQPIIAAYRAHAKQAAAQGQAIPPVPAEIYQHQAIQTAIITNHMVALQSKLGAEKTKLLEEYFKREVTPHVSLTNVMHPSPAAAISGTTPPQ